ncbi:MAG: CoA transferase, partial [Betaproteobacteria bacterium]|nr:CoA transferase [Betaproteobacteria bacterium]
IEKVFMTAPTAHWVTKLDAAAVPGGPVYTYEQTLADPHVVSRNMVTEIDHPRIGRMKNMGSPVKTSVPLTKPRTAAPWLGQHSDSVLKTLGYKDAEIEAMHAQGVIYDKYRKKA